MIFDKILFKNNKAPYISDTNLNKMQDNIKKSIEEVDTKTSNLAGNIESEDISNQIISNSNFTIVSNYCKKILNFVNLNLTFKIVKSQTGYNTLAKINSDDLKPVGGITFQAQFSGMVKNLSGAIRGSGDIDIYIPENFEIPTDSEIRMNTSYIAGIAGSGSEQSEKPYYLKSETYTKNEIDKTNETQNSDISYLEDKTENIEARQLEGHDKTINILNLKNSSVDTAMLSNATAYVTRSGFTTTDFIKVNVGDKIFVDYKMPINLFSFVCFDKDKNIINKLKTSSDWTKFGLYVVEENVSYIKFTIQTSQIGTYGVYLNTEEAPENFIEYGESHLNWLKINENNIDNNSVIEEKLDEKLQKKIARAEQIEKQIPTIETEIAETVTLIDSADLGAEVSIFGNLKQEIREGYNLINLEDKDSTTVNNLIYSISNGILNLNGTPSATAIIYIPLVFHGNVFDRGDYTLQIFSNFIPAENFNISFQDTSIITTNLKNKNITDVTFNLQSSTTEIKLCLEIQPQTITNGQLKFQVVSGMQAKEYEEFGEPIPSINYLSEINIVGDNKNIYNENADTTEYYINSNGIETIGSDGDTFTKQIINSPLEKQYVMSFEKNNSAYVRFSYYKDENFLSREFSNTSNYIFNVPTECNKIDIRIDEKTGSGKYFEKLKIEKGNKATSFSKYNQGSVQILKQNRNILPIEKNASKTKSGVTVTTNEKGEITINGTTTNSFYITLYDNKLRTIDSTAINSSIPTNFKAGKYQFEYKYISGTTNLETPNQNLYFRDTATNAKITYYILKVNKENKSVLCTLDKDTAMRPYLWIGSNITYNNFKFAVQLEPGENINDYIPHEEKTYNLPMQKEFGKVNNYEDCFINKDNKWYEKHFIYHKIFDGSTGNYLGSNNLCYISIPKSIKESGAYCTHYVYSSLNIGLGSLKNNEFAIQSQDSYSNSAFYIKNDASTSQEFKDSLKNLYDNNSPIEIYYPLATPEEIECTNEQSEILEQLQKIETNKGTNIITTDSIAEVKAKYYKDLETLFKKAGVL